jgi:uncharacterized protein YacL
MIWGVFGILIASVIARLVADEWYEPYILFKKYFNVESKEYFLNKIKDIVIVVLTTIITLICVNLLSSVFDAIGNQIVIFVLKICVTVIIPNLIFMIVYRKKEEFKYFKELAYSIVGGFKK